MTKQQEIIKMVRKGNISYNVLEALFYEINETSSRDGLIRDVLDEWYDKAKKEVVESEIENVEDTVGLLDNTDIDWLHKELKKAKGKGRQDRNFNINDFKEYIGNSMQGQVEAELDMSEYLYDCINDGIENYLKSIGYTDEKATEITTALMEDNYGDLMCYWGVETKPVFPDIDEINLSALKETT